jgi:dolichol-phosphate mannosyltransferase
MRGLSIVLPTYNERENLPILLERISRACKRIHYEMIVVDDNSPDGTALLAKSLKKKYPNLRVFVRRKERGLSSAIHFGIKKAKYNSVCVMDTDLQHPPELLPLLFKQLTYADIVIASRFVKGSKIMGLSTVRRIFSKLAIYLSYLFFPRLVVVKDPLSGFFAIDKELVKEKKFRLRGFKFLFELLVRGRWKRVTEIPFTFKKRRYGKSKLGFREFVNFFLLLLELRFQ